MSPLREVVDSIHGQVAKNMDTTMRDVEERIETGLYDLLCIGCPSPFIMCENILNPKSPNDE
jgi:hypothetical protein